MLQKLNVTEILSIEFENTTADSILFVCTTDKGLIKILTLRTILTRGRERVLALSVIDSPAALTADEAPETSEYRLRRSVERSRFEDS